MVSKVGKIELASGILEAKEIKCFKGGGNGPRQILYLQSSNYESWEMAARRQPNGFSCEMTLVDF